METKDVLAHCGMTDRHLEIITGSIPAGYAALRKLVDNTPMFRSFVPGHRSLGWVRNVAVQHALYTSVTSDSGGGLYTKEAWNAAGNHAFLQLHAGNVVLTTHYCGARGSRAVRRAISRSELASRNGDLFASEAKSPDTHMNSGTAYAHIVHGGLSDPVLAAIQIPNRDQITYKLRPLVLELRPPSTTEVEQVQDRLADAIRQKSRELDQGKHAS